MGRPDDARWVWGLEDELVHKARPLHRLALCGAPVGRNFEGLRPGIDEHARCDCIVLDLHERGEIRLVRRTGVGIPTDLGKPR